MKDYIKINRAIDKKSILAEAERINALQKAGMYPVEYKYPLTLQFELTGKCNLACKHCYNRSGDDDRNKATYMDVDKWCELAHQIVNDGGIFQCILSGGEPLLLGDGLFRIMDILHDDGTSFVVITNGLLLNAETARRFKKYRFFWFQVSIDGHTADIHDEFRGVKGSWQNAVSGAMEISHNGIPLVIAHSVTPRNLPYLEDMVKLAHQIGANSIMLGEILPSGRAISNNEIIFSPEERNVFYGKIMELSKKYQGIIRIERSMGLKSQMEQYINRMNSGGIIRPNGDFRLDCMAPFIMGNVLHNTIKEMWLAKGIHAWQNEKVQEYINSIDDLLQAGVLKNHVDKDIKL